MTMIFRQLFDSVSGTYSYLLASRAGGEALIIDPVLEKVDRYCQLLRELDLKLVKAVDTHLHADHVTGLGELRDRTHCMTIMGEQSKADVVAMRVAEGDKVTIEGVSLDVMFTPGHTDDSYSFLMGDRVFTGDTLLIRGTGRTDFQNGDSRAQYDSIFNRLLKLSDETMVFPAHDYKGDTVSTIGEERRYNPRLQVRSVDEYVTLMANLNLPNPKMMDVAVPANMRVGLHQHELAKQGLSLSACDAVACLGRPDVLLVDLRETSERTKHGMLPGALHAPYAAIEDNLQSGGMLREVAAATGRRIVFFCAYGERSAMAVKAAQEAGLANAAHIEGGIDAWKKAGGRVMIGCHDVCCRRASLTKAEQHRFICRRGGFGKYRAIFSAVALANAGTHNH
jgi:glyoxylase-like metal-dependent hydrolase (beta-lactamase superfamily II)/rhodanese-related sulfurtransferase